MNDRGYIQGSPTLMSAGIIGAKRGYKYQYNFEKFFLQIFRKSNSNHEVSFQDICFLYVYLLKPLVKYYIS